MEELTFHSLPFPFPESRREELIYYRQLAVAKESELARRKKLKLQQLKEYVTRRLGEIELTKQTRARSKLNNLDTSSEAVPVTTEDPATPHIQLHRHEEKPILQQITGQDESNSAVPLSSTSSFVCAVPYSPPSLSTTATTAEHSSPLPRKRFFSPPRQSPSPQSKRSSPSPLFSAVRRTPPHSPGLRFSSAQHISPPPSSQPHSSRALFISKSPSPPRSPTLSPHRPVMSLPRTPPQSQYHPPVISPTLPSPGVNRHPPNVMTTPSLQSHPPAVTTTPSPQSHPPAVKTTPSPRSHPPTSHSHRHPPSPGLNRSRDRHVKLAAVWSTSNGGSLPEQQHSPMQGLVANNISKRTASLSPGTKKHQSDAATKLTALAKGYLTRRLLSSEKIQEIVMTIHDAESVLLSLSNPTMAQDFDLQQRVISQLQAAKLQLHDIFFSVSPEQRMAYISHSRLLRQERTFRKIIKGNQPSGLKKGRLSSATVKTLQRKRRTDDSSTLATITNKPLPVPQTLSQTIDVPSTRQSVSGRAVPALSQGKRSVTSTRNAVTARSVRKSVPVGGKVGGAKMVTRNSSRQATPASGSRIPQLSAKKKRPSQNNVSAKTNTGANRLTRTYTKNK